MAEDFTIAHLTDAHLPTHQAFHLGELLGKRALSALNWRLKRHRCHRQEVADALRADVAAYGPDHVAMTGDVVNFGLVREFARGAAWLDRFGPREEVSFVPGNHEAIHAGVETPREAAFARFTTGDEGKPGLWPWVKRRGPVSVIGISTCIATPPFCAQGEVGAAQLERLRDVLTQTSGTLRVILIHHPPTELTIARKHLRDRAKVAEILGEAGGAIVLHGHNHKNQLSWIEGAHGRIPVLGAPAASVPFGESLEPAEWRHLTIRQTGDEWLVEILRRTVTKDKTFADAGRFTLRISRAPG